VTHPSRTLALALLVALVVSIPVSSQVGRIVSEHLALRLPVEREWLGREAIVELERRWRYLSGVTRESIPRSLEVFVDWDAPQSRSNATDATVTIGFGGALARRAPKDHLLRSFTRELALVGLARLSKGRTEQPALRFLAEGMAEIMVHESGQTARALTSTWPLARMLDRVRPLSLAALASAPGGSTATATLRAMAPPITLLLTSFELHGRERTLKLFEGLRKGNLDAAALGVLRIPAAKLEEQWLARVRRATLTDVTVATDDDAPLLEVAAPLPVQPGRSLRLQVAYRDSVGDMELDSMFALDEASGRVSPAVSDGLHKARFELPIEVGRSAGVYGYRVLAVDEAGNARSAGGSYTVAR